MILDRFECLYVWLPRGKLRVHTTVPGAKGRDYNCSQLECKLRLGTIVTAKLTARDEIDPVFPWEDSCVAQSKLS